MNYEYKPSIFIRVYRRLKKVNMEDYWTKFILKAPERFLVGLASGIAVYFLLGLVL